MNSEQNQYKRFMMVENFLTDRAIELPDLKTDNLNIQVPHSIPNNKKNKFVEDYKSLLGAFKISLEPSLTKQAPLEKDSSLLWSFIKFFDKAEAEVYVSDVAIIDDKKDFTKFLNKPLKLLDSIKEAIASTYKMFEQNMVSGLEELLDNVRSVYVTKQNNVPTTAK